MLTKKIGTILQDSMNNESTSLRDLLTKDGDLSNSGLSNDQNSKIDKDMIIMIASPESRKKWDSMKNYPDESYEDMFNRFVRIVEEEEEDLTKEDWDRINRSLREIEKEDTVSHDYIKKRYNIN